MNATPAQTETATRTLIRIRDQHDEIVGVGFLIADRQVLTCSHVVTRAVGGSPEAAEPPTAEFLVEFPFHRNAGRATVGHATVSHWSPQVRHGSELDGDLALLRLRSPHPEGMLPAELSPPVEIEGKFCGAFGFPDGHDLGSWAYAFVQGRVSNGWYQMADEKVTGERIQEGFSGSPVCDEDGNVLGMVAAASRQPRAQQPSKTALMMPTDILIDFVKKAPATEGPDRPRDHHDLKGLSDQQVALLREAIRSVDEFLGLKDQAAKASVRSPMRRLLTLAGVSLPSLGQRLQELKATRWPNTRWRVRLAYIAGTALQQCRSLDQIAYSTSGPAFFDTEPYQFTMLCNSLKEIRAMITDEYPSVLLADDRRI